MTLAQILGLLAPFEPLLKSGLGTIDAAAVAELNSLIANVSSPDLKAFLGAIAGGLNSFINVEIAKLP